MVTKPDEQLLHHIKEGLKKRNKIMEALREGNTIHVTNLLDFCPREYALCLQHEIFFNQSKPSSLAQMVTFEIGRAVEKVVIDALEQEQVAVKFDLIRVNLLPYPIVGTPDTYVLFSVKEKPYIVEIKSIKPESFDELTQPVVNHECQLSLYLWFAEITKMDVHTDSGLLIYVAKTQKTMPIKVYHVQRNDNFIKRVRNQLRELKTFSKTNILPKRICNSKSTFMAKRPCRCVDFCFDEERNNAE
ncbi:MAG: hypothetical protein ACUVUQ_07530 [Thermodesulfovibrionales bacterium]